MPSPLLMLAFVVKGKHLAARRPHTESPRRAVMASALPVCMIDRDDSLDPALVDQELGDKPLVIAMHRLCI